MLFGNHLSTMVKLTLDQGRVPALMGEPGIGKSSFFKSVAEELGTKVFVLACNTLADKADLTAPRLVPTPDGKSFSQEFFPHQTVQEAISYAREHPRETPLLVLDEINRATADITSASLTLITERRIGREELPSNLRIVTAGNDRGNVVALDQASISRFAIFHVEPDAQVLMQILGDGLNGIVREVLTQNPDYVFMKPEADGVLQDGDEDGDAAMAQKSDIFDLGEEMDQITTPRTIDNLSNFLNAVSLDDVRAWSTYPSRMTRPDGKVRELSVLQEAVEAYVGNTPFAHVVVQKLIESTLAPAATAGGPQLSAPKPSFYDGFAGLGTRQDLDDFVGGLDVRERSQALVYALSQREDKALIVTALANGFGMDAATGQVENLDPDSMQQLFKLGSAGMLDRENMNALTNAGSPFAEKMQSVLTTLGLI